MDLFSGDPSQWVYEWVIIAAIFVVAAIIIGLIVWGVQKNKKKKESEQQLATRRRLLDASPLSSAASSPQSSPQGSPVEQFQPMAGGMMLPGATDAAAVVSGTRSNEYADQFDVLRDSPEPPRRSGGYQLPPPPLIENLRPLQQQDASGRKGTVIHVPPPSGDRSQYGALLEVGASPYGIAPLPPRPSGRAVDTPYGVLPSSAFKEPSQTNPQTTNQLPPDGQYGFLPEGFLTERRATAAMPAAVQSAVQRPVPVARPTEQEIQRSDRLQEIQKYFV
jgi:hypothetical protein